jgi:LPXTG-motif cell wall-anchored protein
MTRNRGYAAAAAVVGAGAALLAASRGWWDAPGDAVPGTFASAGDPTTGGDRYPWLTALALVALAGGGAVLATKTFVRTAIGALLVVAGTGIVLGGAVAVAGDAEPFWPIVAVLGGAAVFDAGWLTVYKGRSWPTMGARYERDTRVDDSPKSMWDELDHGRDPTQ